MTSITKLDEFGFLSITGKDALTFTQGYTTCDMDQLNQNQAALGAMCNLQGRMINSFRSVPADDGILLRMDEGLVEPTRDFLKKYILLSKAESRNDSDTWQCFGVRGDGWADLPGTVGEFVEEDGHYIIRVADSGPRFEVWTQQPLTVFENMEQATKADWYRHEIEDGLAWVTGTTADTFIPQMFNYDQLGGISFNKGCYLGQEIVARMQHRGQVKRRLYRGTAAGTADIGDSIVNSDGKNIGTIVTVAERNDTPEVRDILAVMQRQRAEESPQLANGSAVALQPISG